MQMAIDPSLFWFFKTLAALVLPPVGPLLLIALGLWLLRKHRRTGFSFAWAGVLATLLTSSPASVSWMLEGLEPDPPVSEAAVRESHAIVILGGGKRGYAPEYGGETVNRLTLERLRYGARLSRDTGVPILVTGGTLYGRHAEAELMQAALEIDFHVPVRWVEQAARNTRENAQFSAVHLQAAEARRIVLVTHAAHMPRARVEFERLGFEVVPAPTAWMGGGPQSYDGMPQLLPSAASAYAGWIATHEWLGRLAYRLKR